MYKHGFLVQIDNKNRTDKQTLHKKLLGGNKNRKEMELSNRVDKQAKMVRKDARRDP